MTQPFSIERPVGERETNRSDDLEAVRNVLAEHGLCQRTVTGQRNANFKPDLTAGIRIFQRKAGLEPDGLVIPGGPTAHALAFGGEVRVAPVPAEGKMANASTCRRIQGQIDEAEREIAKLGVKFDLLTQLIRQSVAKLRGLPRDIRPPGTIIASINAMAQARRHLQNLPDPQRGEVQDAIDLTYAVDTALSDASEVSNQRLDWQGKLFGLRTLYAQDCRLPS